MTHPHAHEEHEPLDRRDFLRLMGASLAMTGVTGCTSRPRERVFPYVEQPPEVIPGRPLWFATSTEINGYAEGLLVESHEGRPTKIEGHPEHPANLGAASRLAQASILGLYDPDRARGTTEHGHPRSLRDFESSLVRSDENAWSKTGKGLHFLLEPTSSPLIGYLLDELRGNLPECRVHYYTPLGSSSKWEGARLAFGRAIEPQFDLRAASVVVSFGADFLAAGPTAVRYAHDFMSARRVRSPSDAMNRLYVVETALTSTGAKADHRLGQKPSEMLGAALELFLAVRRALPLDRHGALPASLPARNIPKSIESWAKAVAADLAVNQGRSVVMAGERQPAALHAVVHALNELLGNPGKTVRFTMPAPLDAGAPNHELALLCDALDRHEVAALVILGGNPVYTAPGTATFRERLALAPQRVYLGSHENETAAACNWFLPALHYLEAWGDTRAVDGTVAFTQPLVAPLYDGLAPAEIVAMFAGRRESLRSLLRHCWALRDLHDDGAWEAAVARGVLPGTAFPTEPARCDVARVAESVSALAAATVTPYELQLVHDTKVFDGRFANNAWLQELADPITRLSWGNAALVSSHTAADLGATTGRVVRLGVDNHTVDVPILVAPGQPDGVFTLAIGYGRAGHEHVATGVGVSASGLLTDEPLVAPPLSVEVLPTSIALALQQTHPSLEGRRIARSGTLAAHRARPVVSEPPPRMLYHFARNATEQWAMSIDLTACTGCSACVIACQAENNVPVVGRDWVLRGREMHWIRIDRYLGGDDSAPSVELMPMLCQHCEKAPCEYVCPVGATTHSDEGLNEMTYNRCVGTRFCSNNCPYKVRRFNYLNYNADVLPSERLSKNPSVTVRGRGVMEKCTYCVQRIRAAEVNAKNESRRLRADEFTTACAQTCPTQAIVFGSLTTPSSRVATLARSDRSYSALGELGTVPRTTYLERLRNPNPELETST